MTHRRPIRLTYVITDLHVGGVPLHLHRLATGLPSDRFDIRVISLAGEGEIGTRLRKAGIPVSCCGAKSVGDLGALGRLKHLLSACRPDIVHSFLFHANIATRFILPLVGVPRSRLINEIQTLEIERPWHLLLDNLTCRLCRYEVANSQAVLHHLRRRGHLPTSRLRCVYGAVDHERVRLAEPAQRSAFNLPSDVPLILWVGRLDPVKGFEEMVAAMARVSQESSAHLLLVGEGAYRSAVQSLVEQHGLIERVHLLGRRSDVPSLMKMADIFLLTSRTEGMPNALLEAMAAGMPCVVTDIPACREVITDGGNGVLVRRGSVSAISSGVLSVVRNVIWGKQLGAEASEWVAKVFDFGAWLRHWEARYVSTLDGHSAPVVLGEEPVDTKSPEQSHIPSF